MASADTENKSILKVGVHTCSDDAVGNIHVQDYTQFEPRYALTIELTHTETLYNHETDEITETKFAAHTKAANNKEVLQ